MTLFGFVCEDRWVEFSQSYRLIERLHRLLVVLEDDWVLRRPQMPALAIDDVRDRRWLLAAGVSLSRLRKSPALVNSDVQYIIVVGGVPSPLSRPRR
jgi:hypothetical protein